MYLLHKNTCSCLSIVVYINYTVTFVDPITFMPLEDGEVSTQTVVYQHQLNLDSTNGSEIPLLDEHMDGMKLVLQKTVCITMYITSVGYSLLQTSELWTLHDLLSNTIYILIEYPIFILHFMTSKVGNLKIYNLILYYLKLNVWQYISLSHTQATMH